MVHRVLPLVLSTTWLACGAPTAGPRPARPQIGAWGVDLDGMDRSIKPGDDFFRFSGGAWLRRTAIPPDRSTWGPFYILRANAEQDVKAIIEDVTRQPNPPGSAAHKIADAYAAYLDTDAIERAGLAPIAADLATIAQAQSYDAIAAVMARPDLDVAGPLAINTWPDPKTPARYVVNISQSGLGLPDRDYYLATDAKLVLARARYRSYVEAMLALVSDPAAGADADAIVALETRMAGLHWSRAQRGDRDRTYNPKSRAELTAFAPAFPWATVWATRGIPHHDAFVVKELDAVRALTELFRATPIATWRAYLTFHYLDAMADVLPRAFDDLAFELHGHTILGQHEQRARWRRATTAVNAMLGEAVGQLYVRRRFTPDAKAQVTALVDNLRAAYRARITELTWMSAATKQAALRKLAKLRVKIGYPDTWRDYTALAIRAGDPVGNRARARAWDWHRKAARLDQPTDRDEWGMTPQTVNAYYNASFNEIVFPAAILQPPYFDPGADPAVNYGAIGGVIGHEMGHGFDDQGAKSDENGVLRVWWQDRDVAAFQALSARLVQQYAQYEPLPGIHLDGQTTLGENIGDNGGLGVALAAYELSQRGRPAAVIDGFTPEQRLFLSWAQSYREITRDEQIRADVATDPHSPAEFRVNGVVRNLDAWYAAFGVQPGDKLYLAPDQRVHIW